MRRCAGSRGSSSGWQAQPSNASAARPTTHPRRPPPTSSGLKGRACGLTLGCLPKLERASSGLRAAMAARSMRGTSLMVPRCRGLGGGWGGGGGGWASRTGMVRRLLHVGSMLRSPPRRLHRRSPAPAYPSAPSQPRAWHNAQHRHAASLTHDPARRHAQPCTHLRRRVCVDDLGQVALVQAALDAYPRPGLCAGAEGGQGAVGRACARAMSRGGAPPRWLASETLYQLCRFHPAPAAHVHTNPCTAKFHCC